MKSIEQVQRENEKKWMALPGVIGVGIGECEGSPCLKILVSEKSPDGFPKRVEGYRVEVIISGSVRALDSNPDSIR